MKQVTYGCVRQRLRGPAKEEFLILKDLCHVAKNFRNEALYCIRQYFFQTGKYLSYTKVDVIPVYQEGQKNNTTFSGTRIHRGLYQTKDGYQFNADVNGALNILKKSGVVCLNALYSRGAVDMPLRV